MVFSNDCLTCGSSLAATRKLSLACLSNFSSSSVGPDLFIFTFNSSRRLRNHKLLMTNRILRPWKMAILDQTRNRLLAGLYLFLRGFHSHSLSFVDHFATVGGIHRSGFMASCDETIIDGFLIDTFPSFTRFEFSNDKPQENDCQCPANKKH